MGQTSFYVLFHLKISSLINASLSILNPCSIYKMIWVLLFERNKFDKTVKRGMKDKSRVLVERKNVIN